MVTRKTTGKKGRHAPQAWWIFVQEELKKKEQARLRQVVGT